MRTTVSMIGLLALAACGGGGGGGGNPGVDNYVTFLDPTSMEAAALSSLSLSDGATSEGDDTVDGSANTISLGGIAGQFNAARDRITFTVDGGSAEIFDTGTTYVALFSALPNGSDPFRGIIGAPTLQNDRPTADVSTYAGLASARFVIIDADEGATFELTGDSDVSIDFDNSIATLTFDNLDGTKTVGLASPGMIDDLGTLLIEDVTYLDGAFSGGIAEFTPRLYMSGGQEVSDITGRLSGSETVTTLGALFGPGGSEVAGIIFIDDSGDALTISGSYTAN